MLGPYSYHRGDAPVSVCITKGRHEFFANSGAGNITILRKDGTLLLPEFRVAKSARKTSRVFDVGVSADDAQILQCSVEYAKTFFSTVRGVCDAVST